MAFIDEMDESPHDAEPGIWVECEDCGEDFNAMEDGECPYCGDDVDSTREEDA